MYIAISDGTIDVLGSDHAPHTLAEKQVGWKNMWQAPSGTPQLQHYLPRLLTETVTGKLRIADVVRITATNPARRFGLYPRKGALIPGADADIAIVDMRTARPVCEDNIASKAGYTPYAGMNLYGIGRHDPGPRNSRRRQWRDNRRPGYGQFVRPVSAPAPASSLTP